MSSDLTDRRRARNQIRRINRARRFPYNTCGASRHMQMIGEALASGQPYPMLDEEPEHCGLSMLSVVECLFKARSLLLKHGIDPASGYQIKSQAHAAWYARQEARLTAALAAKTAPLPDSDTGGKGAA